MPLETLDAKGLNCPMPILKARQAIDRLGPGDQLEVLSTDPGSVQDFEAFSRATGHTLNESGEVEGVFRFLLTKSG